MNKKPASSNAISAAALKVFSREELTQRFGIPQEIAAKAWSYLPRDMRQVLTALYAQEKLQGA